jgi:hypothetical protein
MKGQTLAITLGVLLVAGAAGFIGWDRSRIADAGSWPSTTGRITANGIQTSAISRGRGYVPSVTFRYEVAGRSYTRSRVWLTARSTFDDREGAEDFLRAYPAGAAVNVFYNPADPDDSALLIESQAGPAIFLILAGLALIAGALYWPRMAAWAQRRRRAAGLPD